MQTIYMDCASVSVSHSKCLKSQLLSYGVYFCKPCGKQKKLAME